MDHNQRIKEAIDQHKAVVVVGTGVSIMATENAPCVSWKGLLENGKTYCVEQTWWDGDRQTAFDLMVRGGDLMIPAQMLRQEFDRRGGAYDHQWLRAALGGLEIKQPAILDAIHALSAPLITLNYDPLLEEGAPSGVRFDPITPKEQYLCSELLKGNDRNKILHLHGYFDRPDTVILDPVSYAQLLNDQFTKALREAIGFSRTMLYVGCGGTFEDPHFENFRKWMSLVCNEAGIVHYRLVREGELVAAQALHKDDGIVPVVFGKEHQELVDFLKILAPTTVPVPVKSTKPTSALLQLPAKPSTFGRDKEQKELVAAILSPFPRPICVSAPLGYGKSNLCLAALHHHEVEARFGPRRYFLRLDAMNTAEKMVRATARALGIGLSAGIDPNDAVMHELGRLPTVLVLDNLETPWEPAAERPQVEHFLGRVSNVKELVLLVTIRGRELPGPLAWQEPVGMLRLLAPADAIAVFTDIAPEHAGAPGLPRLIEELSGWPLPIVLMAHQARGASFGTVLERWNTEKTRMLERGTASSTLDSLHVSIAASLTSPRMSAEAKRLLRTIAELPDGIRVNDLREVGYEQRQARILVDLGLLFEERGRYRVLPAIRSYLVGAGTLVDADRSALHELFLTKLAAQLGGRSGTAQGHDAIEQLRPETGNIDHLLATAIGCWDETKLLEALKGWVEYARFTGGDPSEKIRAALAMLPMEPSSTRADLNRRLGNIALARSQHDEARARYEEARMMYQQVSDVLGEANCIQGLGDIALRRSQHEEARQRFEEAQQMYHQMGSVLGEANCIHSLGEIALARSQHDESRARYEEARLMYQQVGDFLGEANCIQSLGDIALRRSQHDEARARYEEARPMYQQVGDVLGEANCIKSLGDIALARSQHDEARARYEEARPMYQQVGSVLGEANCIKNLGNIALACSQHDEARAHYQEARPMYQQVGSVLGEANCIQSLGDIALTRSQHDEARARYDEARPMYQHVGSVLGEANCIQSLGDIALARSQHDEARACYEEALFLYASLPEPYSMGMTRRRLARMANGKDVASHVKAAKALWASIDRPDLVEELRTEFPDCFK